MGAKRKLPMAMATAIEMAQANGGVLTRWPGGYWSWPGCPTTGGPHYGADVTPHPYWGTRTIVGLINRGLVIVTERLPRGDPCKVKLK